MVLRLPPFSDFECICRIFARFLPLVLQHNLYYVVSSFARGSSHRSTLKKRITFYPCIRISGGLRIHHLWQQCMVQQRYDHPSGMQIGSGSVSGAGSVVTKDTLENVIVVWNPCHALVRHSEQNGRCSAIWLCQDTLFQGKEGGNPQTFQCEQSIAGRKNISAVSLTGFLIHRK